MATNDHGNDIQTQRQLSALMNLVAQTMKGLLEDERLELVTPLSVLPAVYRYTLVPNHTIIEVTVGHANTKIEFSTDGF